MKVQTDDGEFNGEDRLVAIHLTDELKRDVENGALMVNMLFPVHARYEINGRKGTELRNDTQALAKLKKQDIENIRNMPEHRCIYSVVPEDCNVEETKEILSDFKEKVHE